MLTLRVRSAAVTGSVQAVPLSLTQTLIMGSQSLKASGK